MAKQAENTWQAKPRHQILSESAEASTWKGGKDTNHGTSSQRYASSDDTFGDNERKAVKAFLAAYEMRGPNLKEDIQHLRKVAELHVKSAMHTQNVYNLLRASGLFNVCLKLTENAEDEALADEIRDSLIEFENAALKRCLKLKPAQISKFEHVASRQKHQAALKDMMKLYEADMGLMMALLKELPDVKSTLNKAAEEQQKKLMLLEDKILALYKVMTEEVLRRRLALFKEVLLECIALLGGDLPCQYALTVNSRWQLGLASPNEPISCYILIEKNDAACKTYFRNLLTLFGMKVINLCETSIQFLNIKSLNWYDDGMRLKGLALYDFIDDTEKKYFTSIPMESVFTIRELMAAAQSSAGDKRAAIKEICDGIHMVAGSQKLFKQLCALRSTVMQREQGDKDYKTTLQEKLKAIITPSDILDIEFAEKHGINHLRTKLDAFVGQFTDIVFDLEKDIQAQTTMKRLEELAVDGSDFCYADISINTVESGDTFQSKLSVPPALEQTPRLMEQPPPLQKVSTTRELTKTTGPSQKNDVHNLAKKSAAEPVLKELKRRKQDLVEKSSDFFRGYMIKNNGELLGYTKRLPKRKSEQVLKDDETADDDSSPDDMANVPDLLPSRPEILSLKPKDIPENRTKPKNASNRVGPQPRPTSKAVKPLPEKPNTQVPVERLVHDVMVESSGKATALCSSAFRALMLLNCYSSIIKQLEKVEINIKAARKDSVEKNLCLRMLQITVPFLEHIEPVVRQQNINAALKKSLQTLDMKQKEDELAVAVMNIYSSKYDLACLAIYKYMENRSDITFVGEPYVSDFIEVGEELLEEELVSLSRYTLLLEMMGFCKKKMNDHRASLEYYEQLSSFIHSDRLKWLEANKQQALCCQSLGMKEKGMKILLQMGAELKGTKRKVEKDIREEVRILQQEFEKIL